MIRKFWKYGPDVQALFTPFLVAADQTHLTIKAGTHIVVKDADVYKIISFDADTTFALADYLDTGVIQPGKDYFVYVLNFIPAGKTLPVLISLNSTFPGGGFGATADNSRKVGGFHTLCVAVGAISGHPLSDYVAGAILPTSVWCLNHRPHLGCSPSGMVYSALIRKWVDIYIQSGTGASTASAYGAVITDSRTWLNFVDDLAAVGKRLLEDHEFQVIAVGSNEQTNIAGSADPNTTGGHVDTAGRRMISNIGCEDCAGAMWQWLLTQSTRWDGSGGWAWRANTENKGSLYIGGDINDVKLLAGGYWSDGSYCGSRCRYAGNVRWAAPSDVGARGCAEPA